MTQTAEAVRIGHERRLGALRGELLGAGYLTALKAMDIAADLHTGMRKDGLTPEFDHQVGIARYILTLTPSLLYPDETLAAAFLHDTAEDYDLSITEIAARTTQRTADAVWRVTKVFRGTKRDETALFAEMASDPIASIVKGSDRIHNQHTAVGVFKPDKIASYVEETETFIMPMLKAARRSHPEQDKAFQNVRNVLRTQLQMLKAVASID